MGEIGKKKLGNENKVRRKLRRRNQGTNGERKEGYVVEKEWQLWGKKANRHALYSVDEEMNV